MARRFPSSLNSPAGTRTAAESGRGRRSAAEPIKARREGWCRAKPGGEVDGVGHVSGAAQPREGETVSLRARPFDEPGTFRVSGLSAQSAADRQGHRAALRNTEGLSFAKRAGSRVEPVRTGAPGQPRTTSADPRRGRRDPVSCRLLGAGGVALASVVAQDPSRRWELNAPVARAAP